ncbi:MAG: FAD-dependent oxidoreductase [Yaniella sp.]|uniref:FAD-dependent oxidoreductase n=1 Tax=Yaniella sp. TaxID=2773929 RepID=UPI003F96BCA4
MSVTNQQDVAVVGGGIIGVMVAWQLVKQGHDVTVYDQWNTPNDRGASAGESRIFRTAYKEGTEYIPMLEKSLPMWEELEAASDKSVLQMCGGLTIGHPDHPEIRAVIENSQSAGLEYEVLNHAQMSQRFPQYALEEDEVGVYDPAAGIFRPELAVLAARNESIRLGAKPGSTD